MSGECSNRVDEGLESVDDPRRAAEASLGG